MIGYRPDLEDVDVGFGPRLKNPEQRDKCEICRDLAGEGGEPDNENIIDGVVVCDYCAAILLTFSRLREKKK